MFRRLAAQKHVVLAGLISLAVFGIASFWQPLKDLTTTTTPETDAALRCVVAAHLWLVLAILGHLLLRFVRYWHSMMRPREGDVGHQNGGTAPPQAATSSAGHDGWRTAMEIPSMTATRRIHPHQPPLGTLGGGLALLVVGILLLQSLPTTSKLPTGGHDTPEILILGLIAAVGGLGMTVVGGGELWAHQRARDAFLASNIVVEARVLEQTCDLDRGPYHLGRPTFRVIVVFGCEPTVFKLVASVSRVQYNLLAVGRPVRIRRQTARPEVALFEGERGF